MKLLTLTVLFAVLLGIFSVEAGYQPPNTCPLQSTRPAQPIGLFSANGCPSLFASADKCPIEGIDLCHPLPDLTLSRVPRPLLASTSPEPESTGPLETENLGTEALIGKLIDIAARLEPQFERLLKIQEGIRLLSRPAFPQAGFVLSLITIISFPKKRLLLAGEQLFKWSEEALEASRNSLPGSTQQKNWAGRTWQYIVWFFTFSIYSIGYYTVWFREDSGDKNQVKELTEQNQHLATENEVLKHNNGLYATTNDKLSKQNRGQETHIKYLKTQLKASKEEVARYVKELGELEVERHDQMEGLNNEIEFLKDKVRAAEKVVDAMVMDEEGK
ncbi:hypothetical protein FGLOB1_1780 [Fusarium globosum]|uniref:Uncharacterized protein n=1 Tax=Fusarium globosum TaxID=78864 RepID=A0A8H6DI00_9HYPO|nr:hypothetical protein FGLOB1_1780 [Fusarium globosum]